MNPKEVNTLDTEQVRRILHTVVAGTKQLMARLVYNSLFILKGSSTEQKE
jgi:hypothetical protein